MARGPFFEGGAKPRPGEPRRKAPERVKSGKQTSAPIETITPQPAEVVPAASQEALVAQAPVETPQTVAQMEPVPVAEQQHTKEALRVQLLINLEALDSDLAKLQPLLEKYEQSPSANSSVVTQMKSGITELLKRQDEYRSILTVSSSEQGEQSAERSALEGQPVPAAEAARYGIGEFEFTTDLDPRIVHEAIQRAEVIVAEAVNDAAAVREKAQTEAAEMIDTAKRATGISFPHIPDFARVQPVDLGAEMHDALGAVGQLFAAEYAKKEPQPPIDELILASATSRAASILGSAEQYRSELLAQANAEVAKIQANAEGGAQPVSVEAPTQSASIRFGDAEFSFDGISEQLLRETLQRAEMILDNALSERYLVLDKARGEAASKISAANRKASLPPLLPEWTEPQQQPEAKDLHAELVKLAKRLRVEAATKPADEPVDVWILAQTNSRVGMIHGETERQRKWIEVAASAKVAHIVAGMPGATPAQKKSEEIWDEQLTALASDKTSNYLESLLENTPSHTFTLSDPPRPGDNVDPGGESAKSDEAERAQVKGFEDRLAQIALARRAEELRELLGRKE